jgi:hypothetical protein
MIHPGLAALEKRESIEYAAGYRARLAAIPDSETAHPLLALWLGRRQYGILARCLPRQLQ